MAKPAYVVLSATGVVQNAHTTDIGAVGAPTTNSNSLEMLISLGYQAVREVALTGGSVLIVMNKP
jgi:hypothetical protein